MSTIVYTLQKKDSTSEECHLFKGMLNADLKVCSKDKQSICKMTEFKSNILPDFSCKDEHTARDLCAKKGRNVCGVCVSDLYLTIRK